MASLKGRIKIIKIFALDCVYALTGLVSQNLMYCLDYGYMIGELARPVTL